MAPMVTTKGDANTNFEFSSPIITVVSALPVFELAAPDGEELLSSP